MYWIKKILFRFLPETLYVRTLHRGFYFLYTLGLLKKDKRFKYHYAVKKLIQKDFVVVDIGANLGYFTKTFARKTPEGKVICVEPVPLFANTLKFFLKSNSNVEIFNIALGKENKTVTMALPKSRGVMRTGLPHVLGSKDAKPEESELIEVTMVNTLEFFDKLEKINYIKCDIEGFERYVFEDIEVIINEKRPMVQIEISEVNQEFFFAYFSRLNYRQFGIENFVFVEDNGKQKEEGDFLFVPNESVAEFHKKVAT